MPFTANRPRSWAVPLAGVALGAAAALAFVGGAGNGQGVSALWDLVGDRAALAQDLVPAEDPAATATYDPTTLPPCEPSQTSQSGQPGQPGQSVTVTSEGLPGQPGQSSSQVSQSSQGSISSSQSSSSSTQSQSSSTSGQSQSSGSTSSEASALRATFRLCGTADAQAARAIEQLVGGRGFNARLISLPDGCADLTIDVNSSAPVLTSGRSSSTLSVAAGSDGNNTGRRVAVQIVSENGQTHASITG